MKGELNVKQLLAWLLIYPQFVRDSYEHHLANSLDHMIHFRD